MKQNKYSIIALSLFCLASTTAYATVYKWQDENNQIHYSATPPPNANSTIIKTPHHPSSSAAQEKAQAEKLEAQFNGDKKKELEDKEKATSEEENNRIKALNCKNATEHLTAIKSRTRVKLLDENGKAVMLTPEQKEEEIQRTQEIIKTNCHP